MNNRAALKLTTARTTPSGRSIQAEGIARHRHDKLRLAQQQSSTDVVKEANLARHLMNATMGEAGAGRGRRRTGPLAERDYEPEALNMLKGMSLLQRAVRHAEAVVAAVTWFAALTLGACLATVDAPPAIAIIIDDLGYQPRNDRAAIAIDELVTFAILPYSPHGATLGASLYAAGKEVYLHLPMEARARNELLGPGALTRDMTVAEFRAATHAALAAVPYLSGVNNHMGSLLTSDPERMGWLMDVLADYPWLTFVDSRTTPHSAARAAARDAHIPYLARDVFLDHERDEASIHARLDELLRHAAHHGEALGIAHPRPATLAVLRARLPHIDGVRLVRVSELGDRRACRARLGRASVAAAPPPAQRTDGSTETGYAAHPYAER